MGHARTRSVALVGVQGHVVEVEADLALGLPGLTLIGLPDAALTEARDRIRAAIVNTGEAWPQRRMTIALSPATLPKRGSALDTAMAVVVLAAAGRVPVAALVDRVLLGELGLDGRVRGVRGILPAVLAAVEAGVEEVVVPTANLAEARLVPGVTVTGVGSLAELLARLRGEPVDEALPETEPPHEAPVEESPDLAEVLGQSTARRALEIAAAGGHHLFLLGPPGCGKTMLARRLPGILPALSDRDALQVTAVHSVAGTLPAGSPLVRRPPFQDPHHSASVPALIGGGSGLARPGAVSLAHRGVLFLDEAPEFASPALEALRQPLESGEVAIARAAGIARFPASFQLIAAANPCPCAAPGVLCECPSSVRRRYLSRLSGPLWDRIDLQVTLTPADRAKLRVAGPAEPSAAVAARVAAARERAAHRLRATPWQRAGDVPGPACRRLFPLPWDSAEELERAADRGRLSNRGADRVLRVAWTLADLAGRRAPDPGDVGEAVTLRLGRTA